MIQVKRLSYTYPSASSPTLHQLDFTIDQGEIFGFLGPSGAGKSTTQKLLYKILSADEGEIEIKGKALNRWGKAYYEQIGVSFEFPNHYLKLTGRENLALFASFYSKDRLLAFEKLFAMVGLEAAMDQRVEEYSKGMKVRLNFIRAIMHQPDLYFFDEPTSGLDPVNAHKIKQHIHRLKAQGKTVFITTHDMATADELCDRVAFIINGRIEVTEAPSVLKHQYGENRVVVEVKHQGKREFGLESLGSNHEFLQFIKSDAVQRIYTKEASLEEVFIRITGKALHQ
ncbi:MAG: ABC transporter ATP-binding protein [Bacteroidota bacterium]